MINDYELILKIGDIVIVITRFLTVLFTCLESRSNKDEYSCEEKSEGEEENTFQK